MQEMVETWFQGTQCPERCRDADTFIERFEEDDKIQTYRYGSSVLAKGFQHAHHAKNLFHHASKIRVTLPPC